MSDQSIRPGDVTNLPPRLTITKWQLVYAGWTLTLLAYIVVLNLWVEFNDKVVIDSFVISIATSVVLLILLVIILGLEHRVKHWFAQREGTVYRVLGAVSTLLILFLSKFVILEVVDIVFGDHVSLGHLLEVILIVVAMMIAGQLMQTIYDSLGVNESSTESPPSGDDESPSSTSR